MSTNKEKLENIRNYVKLIKQMFNYMSVNLDDMKSSIGEIEKIINESDDSPEVPIRYYVLDGVEFRVYTPRSCPFLGKDMDSMNFLGLECNHPKTEFNVCQCTTDFLRILEKCPLKVK